MKLFEFFSVPELKDEDHKDHSHDTKAEREHLANDVFWYILDNDRLHKEYFIPIARKMVEELKKTKDIDRQKYTECWMPMVESGCLEYYKENDLQGNPKKIFDQDFCKSICERLAEQNIEDVRKGEYNLGQ